MILPLPFSGNRYLIVSVSVRRFAPAYRPIARDERFITLIEEANYRLPKILAEATSRGPASPCASTWYNPGDVADAGDKRPT